MKADFFYGRLYFILIITLGLGACNNGNKEPDKVAEEKNDAKFNGPDEKDANALTNAYGGSVFEKALSDSVKIWSTDKEIRALADSMQMAHSSINNQIKDLAAKKTISLPVMLTSAQEEKIAKLKEKKQGDLSKDYVSGLIADHKEAINMYEKEASEAKDSDIKIWFQNLLPVLRRHLDMATMCKEKLEKKK